MPFDSEGGSQNEQLSFPEISNLGLREEDLKDLAAVLNELAASQTNDGFLSIVEDVKDRYDFSPKSKFDEPKSITLSLGNAEVTVTAIADNKYKISGKLDQKESQ